MHEKTKHFLSPFLALVMICVLLPWNAIEAYAATHSGFCGDNLGSMSIVGVETKNK